MAETVRQRGEISAQYTWDMESVFPTPIAWRESFDDVEAALPDLESFRGRLGDDPTILTQWFTTSEAVAQTVGKLLVYAGSMYNVETHDGEAKARYDRITSLMARVTAATSFAEPEILAIGSITTQQWMDEEPRLASYRHYFDRLESRREHVRTAEIEETLGLVSDPFASGSQVHRVLTDTDMVFEPAIGASGDRIPISQGNINALLNDSDRQLRRTAWENYADAHLQTKNTLATCLATGIKQDVYLARVRRYKSSLEASLLVHNIPVAVFHSLIEAYRRNIHIWHRYWAVRRQALGYDTMHAYDIKAPLTSNPPQAPFEKSMQWIMEGMLPLGDTYVETLRRGVLEERWVDVYPNLGKRSGAYSTGSYGTHPFILMSYNDDLFSMSTLAHELGHSMHSYFTRQSQPFIYSRYGLFVAEVASNFNQALVRAHLLAQNPDPDFQIAVIEEAMANFHRYFFIMPTLARFELEIHQRVEHGEALSAGGLIAFMTELFAEGYGDEVAIDTERVGITWAQFPIHMYANFYVYQYATGIAAAQALAQGVLTDDRAAERYLEFLKAGGSLYPLDALKLAGVDMTTAEPVDRAFAVMAGLVDKLAALVGQAKNTE